MVQKKVPLRMCMGCQEMKNKKELFRIVKLKEGIIQFDPSGKKAGRGAYICKQINCLFLAKKGKRFEKAFAIPISMELFEELQKQMEDLNAT